MKTTASWKKNDPMLKKSNSDYKNIIVGQKNDAGRDGELMIF